MISLEEDMSNPVNQAIDKMLSDQERRHAWLFEAGEQIRKWREEDQREAGGSNKAPASNHEENDNGLG